MTAPMPGNPTVVFREPRIVLLEDRDRPRPGPGQVLVRTLRSLISTGTELTILAGEFPPGGHWALYGKFPFTAGYSNVGVIEAAGEGVESGWIGKRVASFSPHAAWVTLPTTECHPVPDGVADEDATLFAIAMIVMNGVRLSGLTWGESVTIFGAGLLGQFAARIALLAGARPVFVVDPAAARLALLPKDPGVIPVNAASADPASVVLDRTGGRRCDAVFEITGNPSLIPKEFDCLKRPLGRFILLSSPRGATEFDFHNLSNAISSVIIGTHLMAHPPIETPQAPWTRARNAALFFEWVKAGTFPAKFLLSHRVPAAKAPEAYAMLLADRSSAMGVVFEW